MFDPRSKPAALRASLVLCLLSAPSLAVQGQPATQVPMTQYQGMRSGSALGMLRSAPAGSQLLIRAAGQVAYAPAPWSAERFSVPTVTNPDFSEAALLAGVNRGLGTLPPATTLGFGSLSTGGDMFPPVQANGWLDSSTGAWFALAFQVAERANPGLDPYGEPESVLRDLQSLGHNVSDAVLAYYDEGNEQIAGELVNSVVVEQTGEQMGIAAGADSELMGLDFAMGAIANDPLGVRVQLFAPVRDRLFFSLQKQWVESPANAGFIAAFQAVNGIQLDARTIYGMNWNTMAAPLTWSAPKVEYSEDELFGAFGAPHLGKELDAISVFRNAAANRVIFSTTASSGSPDQVLIHDTIAMGTWAGEVPMRTETGQLVSEQMGLNRGGSQTTLDDVRGLCTWDPPEAANPDGAIATPIDHAGMGVVGNKLGLSVNRSRSFEGKLDAKTKPKKAIELPERIDMQVTGIDFGSSGGTVSFFADFGGLTSSQNKLILKTVSVPAGATTASLSLDWDLGMISASGTSSHLHFIALAVPTKKPAVVQTSWTAILNP